LKVIQMHSRPEFDCIESSPRETPENNFEKDRCVHGLLFIWFCKVFEVAIRFIFFFQKKTNSDCRSLKKNFKVQFS